MGKTCASLIVGMLIHIGSRAHTSSFTQLPNPVNFWIELGGKPKWLPLKFGYHDVMCTATILWNDMNPCRDASNFIHKSNSLVLPHFFQIFGICSIWVYQSAEFEYHSDGAGECGRSLSRWKWFFFHVSAWRMSIVLLPDLLLVLCRSVNFFFFNFTRSYLTFSLSLSLSLSLSPLTQLKLLRVNVTASRKPNYFACRALARCWPRHEMVPSWVFWKLLHSLWAAWIVFMERHLLDKCQEAPCREPWNLVIGSETSRDLRPFLTSCKPFFAGHALTHDRRSGFVDYGIRGGFLRAKIMKMSNEKICHRVPFSPSSKRIRSRKGSSFARKPV